MLKTSTLAILEDDRKLTKYLLENYKDIKIDVSNGIEELIIDTNIKKITPITYKIKLVKHSIVILYFKCEEINERKYYIPKLNQDYNLSELKSYLSSILQ